MSCCNIEMENRHFIKYKNMIQLYQETKIFLQKGDNMKKYLETLNPLVKTENGIARISEISEKAKKCINKCLDYTFDRYVYMDFDFDDRSRGLSKKEGMFS